MKVEVNGCDVVAVHDEEPQRLAIVEMKRGFSLAMRNLAYSTQPPSAAKAASLSSGWNYSNATG